jgi:hypothetical protein
MFLVGRCDFYTIKIDIAWTPEPYSTGGENKK